LRNGATQRGAHRKGADGGDARKESSAEEGLRWWEPARRTPGRWGKRVRRSGMDRRDERRRGGGDRPAGGGSLLNGAVGDSRGGEVRQQGRHAAWGRAWGLAPTDGQRPDRGPTTSRAGDAPLFQQWHADTADAWAPTGGGRGSEERGARGRPREMWSGPSRMNSSIYGLFKLIQTSSN
jgi:hypothetical protein